MIALLHTKGMSAGFLAFALVAAVVLIGIAWYSCPQGIGPL
jgi:hypothetical protein